MSTNKPRTIYKTDFTVANAKEKIFSDGWRTSSDVKFTKTGLCLDAHSNQLIELKKQFNLDSDGIEFSFIPKNIPICLRIERRVAENKNGFSSTAELQGNTIKIYNSALSYGDPPQKVLAESILPFAICQGNIYTIRLEHDVDTVSVSVFNADNSGRVEFASQGKGVDNAGRCWDYPRLCIMEGAAHILSFNYFTRLPHSPTLIIIGDSIVEGDTLRNQPAGSKARFAAQIAEATKGGAVIMGTAGEQATHFADNKLTLLQTAFSKAKYILLQHMTNDIDFSQWRIATDKIINAASAIGAQPIIGYMPPRAGREHLYANILDYIEKNQYRHIRFDRALTIKGQASQRDLSMFLPDGLHPNTKGHLNMYLQARLDAPYLFE